MGSSKMTSLKITLLPLTICLLLSLNSQVSGKPSPKHLLIETKENAKKMPRRANAKDLNNSDYDINAGSFHNGPGGLVVSQDYNVNSGVLNNNGGVINSRDYDINAGSFHNSGSVISNDYDVNSIALNNNGGTINSVDYNAKAKAKAKKNSDYDINAGSFHNSGFVGSFGGK